MVAMSAVALDRVAGALWGALIADSLAMPAHWYYGGQREIEADFGGPITSYTVSVTAQGRASQKKSIMALSNTGGAGRGGDQGSIIGDVINHGKKPYWARDKNYHYHHTLQAGENTLEANLMRLAMRSITANEGQFSQGKFREDYAAFMTTPGSHNDTYASTAHRMFFKNHQEGVPLEACADNDAHNVDTIDAFDIPVVAALATVARAEAEAVEAVKASALATRALSPRVASLSGAFTLFFRDLVAEGNPKAAANAFAERLGVDLASSGWDHDPVTA